MGRALWRAVARHFTEMVVWQLADEVRQQTFGLTARPAFKRDLKLHSQTEDAAHSVCRNIAEGFGCTSHREMARFVVIARRSLNELQDALIGATQKRHISREDLIPINSLLRRLYPAMAGWLAYLTRTDEPGPDRTVQRRQNRTNKNPNRTGPRR
jgi:four helix bundle protein